MSLSGTIPTFGPATWVDVTNNWRSEDADWLMERGIVRYANTSDIPTLSAGETVYDSSKDRLVYGSSASGTPPPRIVLASANLQVIDSSTTATLINATAGSHGVALLADGSINVLSKATVGSTTTFPAVTLDTVSTSGRATFVGATGSFVVSVANTRLEVTGQLFSPSVISNALATTGSPGSLVVVGPSTLQAVTATTITATSISAGSGTISATGGLVTAASVVGTAIAVGTTGLVPITGASSITFPSGTAIVLAASTGTVTYKIGANSAPVAGWHVSAVAPTSGDSGWPDGTLWLVI